MCDCLDKVRNLLIKETGSPWIMYQNICVGINGDDTQKVTLCFGYENTVPNGNKKNAKSFIAGSYCTFCGKKYLEK